MPPTFSLPTLPVTNLSQTVGRLTCYPQATTSSPAQSASDLGQRVTCQLQANSPLLSRARKDLARLVDNFGTDCNPAADSPARTALLGLIAGYVAKLDICTDTVNALADANYTATAARISAIVSTPWGFVRVGDPDRANLFLGSRQIVSEADLYNGVFTNHHAPTTTVPNAVRNRIAALVKAANPSPAEIVIYANNKHQTSFNPTTSNSTGIPHDPTACTQVYRIDLICIDGRLQADTNSVLGLNVRQDAIGTAAEQIAPIPNLPSVSENSFAVNSAASCAALYYHFVQHEEFGRTHGDTSRQLAEVLDANFRAGTRPIEKEPSGPIHAAEISIQEVFGDWSSTDIDSDDELVVISRDRTPSPPTLPPPPTQAANPLGLTYDTDTSDSDTDGWIDADSPPPTKRRKQQHPRRHPFFA